MEDLQLPRELPLLHPYLCESPGSVLYELNQYFSCSKVFPLFLYPLPVSLNLWAWLALSLSITDFVPAARLKKRLHPALISLLPANFHQPLPPLQPKPQKPLPCTSTGQRVGSLAPQCQSLLIFSQDILLTYLY